MMFMVPVSPFAWYGLYVQPALGMVALGYLIALIAIVFTAFSYGTMSSRYPIAGSVYSYVQRTTKPELGFLAGWAITLDYLLLPAVTVTLGGLFAAELLPSVPLIVWIVGLGAIACVINVLGIQVVSSVSWTLFYFQCAVIVYFIVMVFVRMGQGTIEMNTVAFYNAANFDLGAVAGATVIIIVSFLGFDATSTLAEEAKNPRRSVPRAVVLSVVAVGFMYIMIAFFAGVAYPHWQALGSDTAFIDIAMAIGGEPLRVLVLISLVVSVGFACTVTAQASVSRILYSMGRDGIIPRAAAKLSQRYQTPWLTTIVVTAASMVLAVAISLDLLASLLSFGALTGFMALNLSVVWKFFVKAETKSGAVFVKYLVSPVIGFGVCAWIFSSITSTAYLVGFSWLAVGFVYLLAKTRFFTKAAPVLELSEDILGPDATRPSGDVPKGAGTAIPVASGDEV
jgi:amino acid transporter